MSCQLSSNHISFKLSSSLFICIIKIPSSLFLAASQGPEHGDFSTAGKGCYAQIWHCFTMPHIKLYYFTCQVETDLLQIYGRDGLMSHRALGSMFFIWLSLLLFPWNDLSYLAI